MAEEIRSEENLSSIEITRNAKGQAQFKIKVYNIDPDSAKDNATRIYTELNKEFNIN